MMDNGTKLSAGLLLGVFLLYTWYWRVYSSSTDSAARLLAATFRGHGSLPLMALLQGGTYYTYTMACK